MHYFTSTRDKLNRKTASEAILEGLSTDGGLYTPDLSEYKAFDLNEFLNMNYQEMAVKIIGTILDDYTEEEIRANIKTDWYVRGEELLERKLITNWVSTIDELL